MTTDLERAVEAVEAELRERLKLKYMGNCKCGKCQLVPLDLIERAILALARPLPPPPVERKKDG